MMEFVDLLLINNDIVRIEYKGNDIDAFYENLSNAEKRGDSWSVNMLDKTTAKINGIHVSQINMKNVIAWL